MNVYYRASGGRGHHTREGTTLFYRMFGLPSGDYVTTATQVT